MYSRQRSNDNSNSNSNSNSNENERSRVSNPISVPIQRYSELSLQRYCFEGIPQKAQDIILFGQNKFQQILERFQTTVFMRLMRKLAYQSIPNNLVIRKLIKSNDEFNSAKFLQDATEKIKTQIDRNETWIRVNIIERPQIVRFKEHLILKKEKKAKMYEKVEQLLIKIAEKKKKKRVDQIIEKFKQMRAKNASTYERNPQLTRIQQKIKQLRAEDDIKFAQDQDQINKYKQWLDENQRKLERRTGLNLSKLKKWN